MRAAIGVLLVVVGPVVAARAFTEASPNANSGPKLAERDRLADEANRLYRKGRIAEAIAAVERVLSLETELFGRIHVDVAESHRFLARLREVRREFKQARSSRREVLSILTRLHGKTDWRVADARWQLKDVDRLEQQTTAQRRQHAQATQLYREAWHLYRQGKYAPALETARREIGLRSSVYGDDHPQYATSLIAFAVLAESAGDIALAQQRLEEALKILHAGVGVSHPKYIGGLRNLADLQKTTGEYRAAATSYRRAIQLTEASLGRKHPSWAAALNNLGLLYRTVGRPRDAEAALKTALDAKKSIYGEGHTALASTLTNLGGVCLDLGDAAKAELHLIHALEVRRRSLGTSHPRLLPTLEQLAAAHAAQRQFERAAEMLRESRRIAADTYGDSHPSFATVLNASAGLAVERGRYAEADGDYQRALAIFEKHYGRNHWRTAAALNNLANVQYSTGRFKEAAELYVRAGGVLRDTLGPRHQKYALNRFSLGQTYAAMRRFDDARRLLREALDVSHENLHVLAAVQSHRQQLELAASLRRTLDAWLSVAPESGVSPTHMWREVLRWKGRGLTRQRQVQAARRRPDLKSVVEELNQTSRRLASLMFAAPSDANAAAALRMEVATLTEQRERLEGRLAAATEIGKPAARFDRRVRDALPAETVLVDFLEFEHFLPPQNGSKSPVSAPATVAFLVRNGRAPVMVRLGTTAGIEQAIDAWRTAIVRGGGGLRGVVREASGSKTDSAPQTTVYKRLWAPLEKHVAGAKIVLISPDGATTRCPFSALPVGKERYLIEQYRIGQIPVPALLPETVSGTDDHRRRNDPGLFCVGGVQFGTHPNQRSARSVSPPGDPQAVRGSKPTAFPDLPATAREVEGIARLHRTAFPDGDRRILRDAAATEQAVRRQAAGCSYLHFATHGFFTPGAGDDGSAAALAARFHPGLLSGLALAGANRNNRTDGLGEGDDGILTAFEVGRMTGLQAELVVLSACETGLGKVAGGEGLLGLQRAFHTCGVRTVVASLWQVDDAATQALMVEFYRNLWERRIGKLDALREAQLKLLREGSIAAGRKSAKPAKAQPAVWASFVLSGDWR